MIPSNPMRPIRHSTVGIVLIFLSILFFFGGPDHYSLRSFKVFWNLGHIVYFALLPLVIFSFVPTKKLNLRAQIFIILGLTLILGLLVELIQAGFGRTPDVGDLFRNIVGAVVGIVFLLPARKTMPKLPRRLLQIITIGMVTSQIFLIAIALTDEYQANAKFPILADFESLFEIQRWRGDAAFAIDAAFAVTGKFSMRVSLQTDPYSGVSLKYFPENWERFNRFQFHVYNPSSEKLSITCRIHDRIHRQRIQRYEDRFNRKFTLTHGWNTIHIDLAQVKNAPAGRQMDMRHICGIGIFAAHLTQPRVIYIDDVLLSE